MNKYHVGERRGGGSERSHLYEVAGQVLFFLEGHVTLEELDTAVASAFLHDVVEDYSHLYPKAKLSIDFKEDTVTVTMNVCKWEDFKKIEEDYIQYFKNVSSHIFSIFVKVSDRIHNLSTCIEGMSEKRIFSYIHETETYFYPMIKKARKDYPQFYMALTAMKQHLEYRIKMIKLVLDAKKR